MVTDRTLGTLSFADGSVEGKVNLWSSPRATDYVAAAAEGRARARELVAFIRQQSAPQALVRVSESIAKRGEYGALEIGFFALIAEEVM